MTHERSAQYAGEDMANTLLHFLPRSEPDTLADAVMSALEHYNLRSERPDELTLLSCLRSLQAAIEQRIRSI